MPHDDVAARQNSSRVKTAMPGRNRLLFFLSIVLLVLALMSLFAPLIMERSIPIWLRFKAARSGLEISFTEVHAPFLRPIEIQNLQITRAGMGGPHFQLTAEKVEAGLSLAAIFGTSEKTPLLRSLRIRHARAWARGRGPESATEIDWPLLATLLPGRLDISADEIRLEQRFAQMVLRDATVFTSTGKSGALSIGSIAIRAPFLQNNFADVRGVARWEDNRLILGSLRLLDGLTVDALMFDLSRLGSARLGTELGISAFGGHIRTNVTTERNEKARIWDVAGTASAISLERLATALGVTEPVRGSLRASKFTFRGDPRDVVHATASVWTELVDFSWRERKADAIMLGANFYSRTMQLQQLYIKQRRNELTLSGETTIGSDWLNPDFRGDIVASLKDLGQFAELFGASPAAFAGAVAVRGRVHTRERNVDGELAITGDDLTVFYNPVDSLTARLGLDAKRLRLDELELKHNDDVLHANGAIDFARNQAFEVSAELSCQELGDYDLKLPLLGSPAGACKGKVESKGDATEYRAMVTGETGSFAISAETVAHNQSFTIEHLALVDGDIRADFTGEAVMIAPRKFRLTLTPASELRLDLPQDQTICLGGIKMSRGEAGIPPSKIVIDSNELSVDSQIYKLCRGHEEGQPVLIAIPSAPQPAATPAPTP
jgi:hypothetical protein